MVTSSGRDLSASAQGKLKSRGSQKMQVHTKNPQPSANILTVRVAVVDDHPLFRAGTVQALAKTDGLEVVGEGATAADALKIARELSPDVMVLDLRLPGGGVEAIINIARDCPNVRILVLTASENEQDVTATLQAG